MQKTSRVLIVHEDNEFGGYGAELAAQLADKAIRLARRPGAALLRPRGSQLPLRPSDGGHDLPDTEGIVTRARALVEW